MCLNGTVFTHMYESNNKIPASQNAFFSGRLKDQNLRKRRIAQPTCSSSSASKSSRNDKVSSSHKDRSTSWVEARSSIRSEIFIGRSIASQMDRATLETP